MKHLSSLSLFKFSISTSSVVSSSELVNSSKIIMSGSLYNALAIPILCFSPPEIFKLLSPKLLSL